MDGVQHRTSSPEFNNWKYCKFWKRYQLHCHKFACTSLSRPTLEKSLPHRCRVGFLLFLSAIALLGCSHPCLASVLFAAHSYLKWSFAETFLPCQRCPLSGLGLHINYGHKTHYIVILLICHFVHNSSIFNSKLWSPEVNQVYSKQIKSSKDRK